MEGPVDLSSRVILHLDLDCFYAQVEQKRLGIPRDVPCAVQQWDGLIAVNYAARARGISRHMRVGEAKKACPELQLVHVRTIGEGGSDAPETEGSAQSRGRAKACLQRYRQASGDIIRVLQRVAGPACPFEKGGLDEMFIDVTGIVEGEMKAKTGLDEPLHQLHEGQDAVAALASCFAEAEAVSDVVGGPLDVQNCMDRRLVAGALVAQRLRRAVLQELQLTCSAGIASNKVLAKLASSRHKPNKQAVVLPRGVRDMMQDIPVAKIWGLGGKLGQALEQRFGGTSAVQVQAVPLAQLQAALGEEQGAFVFHQVRGQSRDPVVPKSLVKSINSCKSFEATGKLGTIEMWMGILAEELAQRLGDDEAEHRRRARTLALHYTGGSALGGGGGGGGSRLQRQQQGQQQQLPARGERSVRCPLPAHGKEGPSGAAIAVSAMAAFRKLPDALPCVRLALSASDFTSGPGDSGRTITSFFAASSCGDAQGRDKRMKADDGSSRPDAGGRGAWQQEPEDGCRQQQQGGSSGVDEGACGGEREGGCEEEWQRGQLRERQVSEPAPAGGGSALSLHAVQGRGLGVGPEQPGAMRNVEVDEQGCTDSCVSEGQPRSDLNHLHRGSADIEGEGCGPGGGLLGGAEQGMQELGPELACGAAFEGVDLAEQRRILQEIQRTRAGGGRACRGSAAAAAAEGQGPRRHGQRAAGAGAGARRWEGTGRQAAGYRPAVWKETMRTFIMKT